MKFETGFTTKERPLDDPWFERFNTIASFQDYELFEGQKQDREKQKEQFLSGKLENPVLNYSKLEGFNLDKREKLLLDLKKEIKQNENNEVLKKTYLWKINEKIAEIRMLKATQEGNDRHFVKYSRFIYGEPAKDIYSYTLFQLKKVVDREMSNENPEINQVAKRINTELFHTLMDNKATIDPEEFNFPKVKSVKDEKQYQAEEIKNAFQEALETYKLMGWKAIIDETGSGTGVRTSQEQKAIIIPQSRKIRETYLKSLIEHELGTHVLRREAGERSKLRLLGLGLDRYLPGEEGIATYREQLIEGARNFAGFEGHLAISLAMGIDGKQRNFRQVFNIMRDYYFINSSKKDISEAWETASTSAWNRCVRTFRGTTCKTPGACFTRDIVYREGNIGIWNVVKNNSEEIKRFSIGKYDPANLRHIWILEQLGISEKDLQQLDN